MKNIASWTHFQPIAVPVDGVVPFVSINTKDGTSVEISVRNRKNEFVTIEIPWKQFAELVGDCNVGMAKHRRYVP